MTHKKDRDKIIDEIPKNELKTPPRLACFLRSIYHPDISEFFVTRKDPKSKSQKTEKKKNLSNLSLYHHRPTSKRGFLFLLIII